ncbi:unnamed protein product [Anisakis simplex]|uniref:Secreted protein n=1 Tax=Anisakis simplex TaxID=6269 RepID=A0A0M3KF77_ANISI|nr:unnamed protein product [Anisakis simplex]
MCEIEARGWLIVVLSVWLALSTARQLFDLVGKLWIPIVFNLFQNVYGTAEVSSRSLSLENLKSCSAILHSVVNIFAHFEGGNEHFQI